MLMQDVFGYVLQQSFFLMNMAITICYETYMLFFFLLSLSVISLCLDFVHVHSR